MKIKILIIAITMIIITLIITLGYFNFKTALVIQEDIINTKDKPVVSNFIGKKIIYIDSYHTGYEWSDGLKRGIDSVLKDYPDIIFKEIEMDTKRNGEEEFKIKAGILAKNKIEEFNPDVILVSDDNAFKYVIQEYYKNSDIPVVFCGLNWDASIYDAPYKNNAGMIEVALIDELIKYLKFYSKGEKIGFIAGDSETAKKEAYYPQKIFNLKFKEVYVSDYMEFVNEYLKLQDEVDMIYFHNNAAIKNWDDNQAKEFFDQNTKVPIGVIYDWLGNYSLLGIIVVPEEQGEFAINSALKILNGTKPSDIPLGYNKKGNLLLNLKTAEKLKINFSPNMLKNANILR